MSGRYRNRTIVANLAITARRTARAKAAFVEIRGEDGPAGARSRELAIAALPSKTWKGRALCLLRCHGETGRGPHDYAVEEALLWSLISLDRYRCPFHA